MSELGQFAGLLQRRAGGFVLQTGKGQSLHLELLRTPVDLVEKQVVVTGYLRGDSVLEVEAVRAITASPISP